METLAANNIHLKDLLLKKYNPYKLGFRMNGYGRPGQYWNQTELELLKEYFSKETIKLISGVKVIWDITYEDTKKNKIVFLRSLFERFARVIYINEIKKCITNIPKTSPEYFCKSQLTDLMESKIAKDTIFSSMGQPIPFLEYWHNNQEVLSINQLPKVIKAQSFLKDIGKFQTYDNALKYLDQNMPDKAFYFLYETRFPKISFIDKMTTRLIYYEPGANCDKTLLITYPGKKEFEKNIAQQLGMYAYCHKDPKTGIKLNQPLHFFYDYLRIENEIEIEIETRNKNKNSVENCLSCHVNGPILFGKNEAVKETTNNRLKREKLNSVYKDQKKAIWASYDYRINQYKEMFNHRKMLRNKTGQVGPLLNVEDDVRSKILNICIPKNNPFKSLPLKRDVDLRDITNKSMRCSECHNINEHVVINPSLFNRIIPQLRTRIKSMESEHEMPPGISQLVHQSDVKKYKQVFALCLSLENYHFKELRDYAINEYMKEENGYSADQVVKAKLSSQYFSKKAKYRCEYDDTSIDSLDESNKDLDFSNNMLPSFSKEEFSFQVSGDEYGNNKAYCNPGSGIINFPLSLVPSCQMDCKPFQLTLNFNIKGEFINFTHDMNNFPLTKYKHEPMSRGEIIELQKWLKVYSSPHSTIPARDEFVDGLTGATKVDLPVYGAGYTFHELLKYTTAFSKFISKEKEQFKKRCGK